MAGDSTHNVFVTMAASNHAKDNDREKDDYYATDPIAAEWLLKLDSFSDVWECACGGGHLAKIFDKAGVLSRASDIIVRDYPCEQLDFLNYNGEWGGDIITNPPFKLCMEFMEKGLSLLQPGRKFALFLPFRYLEGKSRRKVFDKYPPKKVWVSSSRIKCAKSSNFDSFPQGALGYAWFVWEGGAYWQNRIGVV